MDLSEDTKKDLMEYQKLQQQLQFVLMQKQQASLQQRESQKALEELKTSSGVCYKFAGGVLVPKTKEDIVKQLGEESESLELREKSLSKQEELFTQRLLSLEKKLSALKNTFGSDGALMS